ncbi:MAG TPA: 4-alpha-glucanotransferase, partial [Treponemataceae bacterium]|nr:4-alpha-glucanotransferase [Treponemataceae bacterium]
MKILNQNTEEKIRNSGILLHPTSLASSPGIGTLGESAYQFIDWLHEAKQSLWQVLPLGPTGYGDSPYASFSTFAGNPLLIDIDTLYKKGYLWDEDMVLPDSIKNQNKAAVDFGALVQWKLPILKRAAKSYLFARVQQYKKQPENSEKDPYAHTSYIKFVRDNAYWLEDYALFMSIKDFYD